MKIRVWQNGTATDYDTLQNISFAPDLDVLNERMSIDEVSCDIITEDVIPVGVECTLVEEETSTLWFSGYITYSEKEEGDFCHIVIQSELLFLDRKTMPAEMYDGESVSYVLSDITDGTLCTIGVDGDIEDYMELYASTLSGYVPEQTARQRLQYILFAKGYFIKTTFNGNPKISKLNETDVTPIPLECTYWRPVKKDDDIVTSVTVVSYSFTERTPSSGEEYVEVGNKQYVVTRTNVTINNTSAPQTAQNDIVFDSVMLVNSSNASAICSLLATYYFARERVEFEAINNAEYMLGGLHSVMLDDEQEATGFLESCSFQFGTQKKAQMRIGSCSTVETNKLTITYVSKSSPVKDKIIGKRTYRFPAGVQYEVTNPYIKTTIGDNVYVFRPSAKTATGTMGSGDTEQTVNCYSALRKNTDTGVLSIYSVDEVNRVSVSSGGTTYYQAEIE